VTDNVFDPVIHHFVGYRYRLFRVAGIIVFYDLQFFAFDPFLVIQAVEP
jgi:hypothetical protein